jgi:hypothetical protein
MVQPAARAETDIKSFLIQILTHQMKMLMAAFVDAKYHTHCQASLDHWTKEIEGWRQQIADLNRTHLRRSGQFFSDNQLQEWQDSEKLVKLAMAQAITAIEKYLTKRQLKPDRRWLRSTLEELYYGKEGQ